MGTGFGVAALIIALVGFFIPIFGIFVTGIALILAAIGALAGDKVFATATAIFSAASIFVFSPSMWAVMATPDDPTGGKTNIYILIGVFLALPFIAMFLRSSGKLMIGKRTK